MVIPLPFKLIESNFTSMPDCQLQGYKENGCLNHSDICPRTYGNILVLAISLCLL